MALKALRPLRHRDLRPRRASRTDDRLRAQLETRILRIQPGRRHRRPRRVVILEELAMHFQHRRQPAAKFLVIAGDMEAVQLAKTMEYSANTTTMLTESNKVDQNQLMIPEADLTPMTL